MTRANAMQGVGARAQERASEVVLVATQINNCIG